jgi:hypothetical protein
LRDATLMNESTNFDIKLGKSFDNVFMQP